MQTEHKRKRLRNLDSILIAVLVIFILVISFEFYGRYAYVNTRGRTVLRVDRLTGDTCTVPCNRDQGIATYVIEPDASHEDEPKKCHSADIVRVSSEIRVPANRKPLPYRVGGFDPASPAIRNWQSHIVHDASELSDGHIYAFSATSFLAVSTWSTGDSVQVCATWSKIENRPFYSVGGNEQAEPATLAI